MSTASAIGYTSGRPYVKESGQQRRVCEASRFVVMVFALRPDGHLQRCRRLHSLAVDHIPRRDFSHRVYVDHVSPMGQSLAERKHFRDRAALQ
jgi:hypothetical protein